MIDEIAMRAPARYVFGCIENGDVDRLFACHAPGRQDLAQHRRQ
jgi:hypothetical protein